MTSQSGEGPRRWAALRALRALADLALPPSCAACGLPDLRLCDGCRRRLRACRWSEGARQVAPRPSPRGMPRAYAAGRYEAPLSRLVSAYKDDGRRDCAGILGAWLGDALDRAIGDLAAGRTAAHPTDGAPVLVVPIPSSAAARRRRGDAPLLAVARRACAGFGRSEVQLVDALRLRRRVADQAGLGADERAANLDHAMRVRPGREALVRGAVCVVVDDVLTTGSTVAEASRALRAAGAVQVCAATICATSRRPVSVPEGSVQAAGRLVGGAV